MKFNDFINYCKLNLSLDYNFKDSDDLKIILKCKNGNKIHIKKENKGKFTKYCNGKVTNECIARGKKSSDPKIRKRAIFALSVRKWNKK